MFVSPTLAVSVWVVVQSVMENVPDAPTPSIDGYGIHSFILNNRQCIDENGVPATQNRSRRWSFGWSGGRHVLPVEVTVFEKRPLAGGLSTYGIISLREPIEASLAEVRMLERLGVRIETGAELGGEVTLDDLRARFDAVFLGLGLGATPALGIPGEERIVDGLAYIEQSKLDPRGMHIGKEVVVIGAGNTAIDCATVAKRLGAARVTMIYRRTEKEMTAYPHEVAFVRGEGVDVRFLTLPVRAVAAGLVCVPVELGAPDASGRPAPVASGGPEFLVHADQVVKAIGQERPSIAQRLGLAMDRGFVKVSGEFETSVAGVFAGGDCIRAKNAASTVMAVQDGKMAAAAIHRRVLESGGSAQSREDAEFSVDASGGNND